MADIDALGTPDPQPGGQRLVHVAEQQVPRLSPPDRIEQRRAAAFHPPRHRVEKQLGNGRRNVRAEHIDRADGRHLRRIDVLVELIRRPVPRAQPAADETERPAAKLNPLPVEHMLARPQVRLPQAGYVDVAVGQVRRRRHDREQLRVLPRRRRLDMAGRFAVQPGPEPCGHRPGRIESLRRPQVNELARRRRTEQVGEYPPPVVGVVNEQQQIAQAEQRVRAVGRDGQCIGPAVHVADHMNPHEHSVGSRVRAIPRRPLWAGLIRRGTVHTDLRNSACRGEPLRTYSAPALADVAGSACLTDVVFSRGDREPSAVMLRRRTSAGDWQDVTADRFRGEVAALARGIIGAGIEPGDRIALMSRTRYEWTLIDYAIWTAGAVTVPVYETSSAEQVEWMLGDSGARAVFAETNAHSATIDGVRSRLPDLDRGIWAMGELDALVAGGQPVSDDELAQRMARRGSADLATILYTSGTTGRPKGCE